MNYYEHHLGDWAAATGHLTWDEDMAYTRLLRSYYHYEKAIPEGQQYRLAKAATPAHRRAVDQVLAEFFELREGHFHQKRADAEIARFQDKQRKAKASAEVRWSQSGRNANASPNAMRTHSEGNAHQTPDTRHQTPDPNTHTPVASATDPGRVCLLMRQVGLPEANPGHPTLLALLNAGCTDAEFVGAAQGAVDRGKGFAYAIGTVKRQREEAAKAVLHNGAMPAAETVYARQMREKYEQIAPGLAARRPGGNSSNVIEMELPNGTTARLG